MVSKRVLVVLLIFDLPIRTHTADTGEDLNSVAGAFLTPST